MIKVIEVLENNQFIIEIEKDSESLRGCSFGVVHDYAYFEGNTYFDNKDGTVNFETRHKSKVHIPIKGFNEIVLPRLISNKYCKPEHLEDRIHDKDDDTWNSEFNRGKFTKPRYKKGDKYPAYSYQDIAIEYWDNEKQKAMIAICLNGEKEFNHITLEFYNKYVKK